MDKITLFTVGFTKKSAEVFFTKLMEAGVRRVVDIRLNNVSQLAGFAKRDDLRFFLKAICGIDYAHVTDLAPAQEILDAYKKQRGEWSTFESDFLALAADRKIEETQRGQLRDGDCLLCSEETPDQCHRRLVAEYLREKWGNVEIVHLV